MVKGFWVGWVHVGRDQELARHHTLNTDKFESMREGSPNRFPHSASKNDAAGPVKEI